MPDTENIIRVRGVDKTLWTELRMAALRDGIPVGQLLNQILQAYLEATPAKGK
jgi:hypothetical protein